MYYYIFGQHADQVGSHNTRNSSDRVGYSKDDARKNATNIIGIHQKPGTVCQATKCEAESYEKHTDVWHLEENTNIAMSFCII